jgi:hypothetical protein
MKNLAKSIAFIFVVFTFTCCEKSSDNNANLDPTCSLNPSKDVKKVREQVIGEWNWVQTETSGRAGNKIENPASTGKQKKLSVAFNGEVTETENGTVTARYIYDIISTPDNEIVLTLSSNNRPVAQYQVASCPKTLRLTNSSVSINEVILYHK